MIERAFEWIELVTEKNRASASERVCREWVSRAEASAISLQWVKGFQWELRFFWSNSREGRFWRELKCISRKGSVRGLQWAWEDFWSNERGGFREREAWEVFLKQWAWEDFAPFWSVRSEKREGGREKRGFLRKERVSAWWKWEEWEVKVAKCESEKRERFFLLHV